jgi:hypothetical protein
MAYWSERNVGDQHSFEHCHPERGCEQVGVINCHQLGECLEEAMNRYDKEQGTKNGKTKRDKERSQRRRKWPTN